MKTSYHNHTTRCGHAQGTEEEYVLAAIAGGYDVIGFSDHTPYPLREGFVSNCRMRVSETQDYFATLLPLKEKYKDQITIRIGFETEYYPSRFGALLDLYRKFPVDYLILGQHGVGLQGGAEGDPDWICSFDATDDRSRLTAYVDAVLAGIATGRFTYVAHPDCFRFVGDEDFYRQEMTRIIRGAKEKDLPLEVNMYGLSDGRHYPNPAFWEEVSRLGAKVVLGRDAHKTERVDPIAEYEAASRFLDRFSLTPLDDVRLIDPLK